MTRRITYALIAVAATASIAGTGTALASGGHATVHHARIAHAALSTTAPQPTDSSDELAATSDPSGPNDQSNGPDPAGTSQTAATGEQSVTEQAAGDGPGGHADEPSNANADHQFQGEE
jgi:hypothetical protein